MAVSLADLMRGSLARAKAAAQEAETGLQTTAAREVADSIKQETAIREAQENLDASSVLQRNLGQLLQNAQGAAAGGKVQQGNFLFDFGSLMK